MKNGGIKLEKNGYIIRDVKYRQGSNLKIILLN